MTDSIWTGLDSAEFTLAGNWSPATVPSGTAEFINNSAPTSITVLAGETLGTMLFDTTALAYTFTLQSINNSNTNLVFSGVGVENLSAFSPTFIVTGGSGTNTALTFENSSSAGNATIDLPGPPIVGSAYTPGSVVFLNNSTAGNATITAPTYGGGVTFYNSSSAGSANISVAGADMEFFGSSTAGNATISSTSVTAITFSGTASAGNAAITVDNSNSLTVSLNFTQNTTAGNATIVDNGGIVQFSGSSTAGDATIILNNNNSLVFQGSSTGGLASFVNNSGGNANLYVTGAGNTFKFTAGSIAGSGNFYIGSDHLTVGGNNQSTVTSGNIVGNYTGSLTKVGSGIMTIDGAATYSGLTEVQAGALVVGDATHSTANISGSAQVDAGALLDFYDNVTGSNTLTIEAQGFLELGGTDTQAIYFAASGGTLAFFHPAATNAELLSGLGPGDTIELPGSTVSSVTFSGNTLTATTDAGTYTFTNVSYGETIAGYSWAPDPMTGLVAINLASSTTYNWINTAGGNWSISANWSSDAVPGVGNNAFISLTGATPYIVIVSKAESAGTLTLNATNATLQISSGGALTIAGALTIDHETAGGGGATILSGGALSVGSISVGNATGSSGAVTVDAGGVVTVGGAIDIGAQAGATGALTVTGTGASVTVGALTVGDAGTGSMSISGGAQVFSVSGSVGTGGGAGTVTIDGTNSQWTMTGQLVVGVINAATGPSITISNGANMTTSTSAADDDQTIDDRIRSGASLTLTSGGKFQDVALLCEYGATLSLSSGAEMILRGVDTTDSEWNLTANGTVTLDDAMLASAAGAITIGVDITGTTPSGSMTTSDGSQISSLITRVAWSTDATGSLTLTGTGTTWSDLATAGGPSDSGTGYIGAYGVGTLLIEAGASMKEADDGNLGFSGGANGTATVEGANSNWTIAAVLVDGDGGKGSLTVSDGGEVYAGSAIIGDLSSSTGTLTVNAGGILDVTGAVDIGAQAGATGALTVTGTGASVTVGALTVGDAGTGSMSISGGAQVFSVSGSVGTGGGAGTVTIDGTNSQWTMTGQLVVGVINAATGPSITISNGANMTTSTSAADDDQTIDDRIRSGASLTLTSGGKFQDVALLCEYGATLSLSSGAEMILRGVDTTDSEWNLTANGTVTLDDAMLASAAGAITIGVDITGTTPSGSMTTSDGSQISSLITRVAWSTDATGSLTLTGTGTTWSDLATAGGPSDSGTGYIGAYGVGTLLIEAGASMKEADDGNLGFSGGANGTATVEGANSNWTIAAVLVDGDGGKGSLTVSDGGEVYAGSAIIGDLSSSTGTLTVNAGGILDVTGAVDIGAQAGATGALTVTGTGASVTATDLDVGGTLTASGGTGTVTIGLAVS